MKLFQFQYGNHNFSKVLRWSMYGFISVLVLLAISFPTFAFSGHIGKTIEELLKVIEKDPNDVDAYFYLGQKYLDTGKPLSAVIIYEKALQKHPFASDLTLNLAHSYYAINDITNSIIYLIKAEKLYLIKSDFGRFTIIPAIRKHLRTALNESENKREDFDFVMIPSYSEVKSTIDKPKLPAEYKAGFLKLLNEEKQGKITQKRLKLLNEVRHQGWALFVNGVTH